MTVTAFGAILLIAAQAPAPRINLGSARIMGREIPIEIPAAGGAPQGPFIEFGGRKFPVLPGGDLGPSYVADGGWGDLAADYRRAQERLAAGKPSEWKFKATIFTRGEVVEHGRDGVWRLRRSSIEPGQIERVLLSLAQFKARAEAMGNGNLRVSFEVQVDNEPLSFVADASGFPLSETVETILAARSNSTVFDAEDKVYRGPFNQQAAFVPFAGDGGNSRLVPVLANAYAGPIEPLADRLASSFATIIGLGNRPEGSRVLMTPEFCAAACDLAPKSDQRRIRESYLPENASSWSALLANAREFPGSGLDSSNVPGLLKIPADQFSLLQSKVGERLGRPGMALGGELLATQSAASLAALVQEVVRSSGHADKPEVKLPQIRSSALAIAIGNKLSLPLTVLGGTGSESIAVKGPASWSEARATSGPLPKVQASGVGGGDQFSLTLGDRTYGPINVSDSLIAGQASASGNWSVVQEPGSRRISITEKGADRLGEVLVAESSNGEALFDLAACKALAVRLTSGGGDPIAIRFYSRDHRVFQLVFGEPLPKPQELPDAPEYDSVKAPIPAPGTEAVLPLNFEIGASGAPIVRVAIGGPLFSEFYERSTTEAITTAFEKLQLLSDPPTNTPSVPINTGLTLADLATAGPTVLNEALKNPDSSIRLNAVGALTRLKAAETIPNLTAQAKSAIPGIALLATRALANQDTPESWNAIRQIVVSGPFDHNRLFAAKTMTGRATTADAPNLSLALTSRSWRLRAECAVLLGQIKEQSTGLVQAAFLTDPEPMVRLAVAQNANPELELVCRRLLYAAVNDVCEAVRSAAYVKLLESPIGEYRDEAIRAVRNEATGIRVAILQRAAKLAKSELRQAALIAISDPYSFVRLEAAKCLLAFQEPVSAAELEPLLRDRDMLVQLTVLDIIDAKAVRLSEADMQPLRQSPYSRVRLRLSSLSR